MSTPPVRFLLVGCGGITHAHLPAFRQYPEHLRLIAACDPAAAARASLIKRTQGWGTVATYPDISDALERHAGECDAVLITTPHWLHHAQARACIEAGLPVLIEKPACITPAEATDLLARARSRNVLVVAGQNRRYEPEALWTRRWLRKQPEQFGELRSFDLHAWQNVEAWIAGKPGRNADFWILDKQRAGGGVVVSLMIHYLDMVRGLTGLDYTEVSARGRSDPPFKNGAESTCSALLTLSNGASGTLHANYLAPRLPEPGEGFSLIGSRGYVGRDQAWRYATTGGENPRDWSWQFENIMPVPDTMDLAPDGSSFVNQLLAFANAVRSGEPPMSHLADNFNTLATVQAIYDSMANGGAATSVQPVPNP